MRNDLQKIKGSLLHATTVIELLSKKNIDIQAIMVDESEYPSIVVHPNRHLWQLICGEVPLYISTDFLAAITAKKPPQVYFAGCRLVW